MTTTRNRRAAGGARLRRRGGDDGAGSRRDVTVRAALVTITALLAWAAPVVAQNESILVCGAAVQGHLGSGATDHYRAVAATDGLATVDVTDTSGSIGLLRLAESNAGETCSGSLLLETGFRQIDVSDCLGTDIGDYTIEYTTTSDGPDNCGRPLRCGVAPLDARFDVPGEVDPYTFPGVGGQQVSFTAAMPGAGDHAVRLRLFGPAGNQVFDSCAGSNTATLQGTGTFTLLVSACVTPITGAYSVTWETAPSCVAAVPSGQFAYVAYLSPPGVAVIDSLTNKTVSFVPLEPVSNRGESSRVRIAPNNAFAFVTFEGGSSIYIIDTATNRSVGAVSVPSANSRTEQLDVAFNPDGAHAYVISSVAGGVLVINTTTRRVESVVPIPLDPEGENLDNALVAVSADGQQLYVAMGSLDQVFIIDIATRAVVATIAVIDPADVSSTNGLVRFAVRPDGGALFATSAKGFYVVDPATRTVVGHVAISSIVSASDSVISPDGRTAYVRAGDIFVVDTAVPTISTTIGIADEFSLYDGGIAIAPDGSRLYVTNPRAEVDNDPQNPPAVLVIDTNARQVIGTVKPAGAMPFGVAVTAPPTGLCVGDDQGQTRVTVGELVTSVNYAADGCPSAMSTLAPQSH